jgi:hypothetical protein
VADDAATRAVASGRQRTIFVVGAGRSGTSAITRGIQALGVHLGDRLKAATGKNPTGFFEDRDLLDIAKRVRGRLGLRSESASLLDAGAWQAAKLDALQAETVETIQRRFGGVAIWGFKYAQTLRMLPFWEGVFQAAQLDPSFVVAARNPLSVAQSRAKLDPLRGRQEKSDLEWLVNVVPYFRDLARHPFVVVDYDLLMADPVGQLERIAELLELPLDDAIRANIRAYAESFLSEGRRHTRFGLEDLDEDAQINPLTRDAYRWLYRLASDEVEPDSAALWEDWSRIEAALAAMAPVLRYVDRLEQELRSRRGPLEALRSALVNMPRPWAR